MQSANAWRDCPSGTSRARWQPEEVQLQLITIAWKACLRDCAQESGARSTRKVRLRPSWWEAAHAWRPCSRSKARARWKPEEVQFQPPERKLLMLIADADNNPTFSGCSPQMPGGTARVARPGPGGNQKRFSSSSLQSPGRPAYATVLKSRARGRPEKCDSGLRGGRPHMPGGHARVAKPGLGGNPKRSSSSPRKENADADC